MYRRMKDLTWLADSRSRVKSFPAGVQDDIGYVLYVAQLAEKSVKAKALHGLGGSVMEIAAHDASGTYRAVYAVSIGESIYVIHAFQKKSKKGRKTPRLEIDLIRDRLKRLKEMLRGMTISRSLAERAMSSATCVTAMRMPKIDRPVSAR